MLLLHLKDVQNLFSSFRRTIAIPYVATRPIPASIYNAFRIISDDNGGLDPPLVVVVLEVVVVVLVGITLDTYTVTSSYPVLPTLSDAVIRIVCGPFEYNLVFHE